MLIGSIQAGAYTYGLYGVPRQKYSAEPVDPVQSVGRSRQGHTTEPVSWMEMLASHATLYNTVHNTRLESAEYAGRNAYARNNDAASYNRYTRNETGSSVSGVNSNSRYARNRAGNNVGNGNGIGHPDTSAHASVRTSAGTGPFDRLLRNVTGTVRHVARSQGGNQQRGYQPIDAVSQLQADFTESVTAAADELTGTDKSDHDRLLERIDQAFNTLNDSLKRQFSRNGQDDEHDEQAGEIEQTLDNSPLGLETLRQVFGSEVQELKDAIKTGTVVPKKSQPFCPPQPHQPLRPHSGGNDTVNRFNVYGVHGTHNAHDTYGSIKTTANPQYDDRPILNAVA